MARKDYNRPIDREYVKAAFQSFLATLKDKLTGDMSDDLDKSIETCFDWTDPTSPVLLDDATLIKAINEVSHNGIKIVEEAYRDDTASSDIYRDIAKTYTAESWVPTIFISNADYPVKDPASTSPYVVEHYAHSLWIPVTKPTEAGSTVSFVVVESEDPKRGNIEDILIKDDAGEDFEQIVPAINQLYKKQLERIDFINTCTFDDWRSEYQNVDTQPNHLYVITDDFQWPLSSGMIRISSDPTAEAFSVLRVPNRDSSAAVKAYIDANGIIYECAFESLAPGYTLTQQGGGAAYVVVDEIVKQTTYKAGSWIYSYDEFYNPDGTPRKSFVWKALNNGGGEDYLYVKVPEEPTDLTNIKTNVMYIWPVNGEDTAHVYIKEEVAADSKWLTLGGSQGTNWIGSFYFYRLLAAYDWHADPDDVTTEKFIPVWSDNTDLVFKLDIDNRTGSTPSPYAFQITSGKLADYKAAVTEEIGGLAADTLNVGDWVRTPYSLLDEFVKQNTISPALPDGRDSQPGDLVTLYVGSTAAAKDSAYIGQYLYKDATNGWKIYSSLSKATYSVEGITRYANDLEYNDDTKELMAIDPAHLGKYTDEYLYTRTIIADNILGNTEPKTEAATKYPDLIPSLEAFIVDSTTKHDPNIQYYISYPDGTHKLVPATISSYLSEFYDTSVVVDNKLKTLRKSKIIYRGADFTSQWPEGMDTGRYLGYILYWTCDTDDPTHEPPYVADQLYSYIVDSDGNITNLGTSSIDLEGYIKNDNVDWTWLTTSLVKGDFANLEARLEGFVIDGPDTNRDLVKNMIVTTNAQNQLSNGYCSRTDTWGLAGWANKYSTGSIVDELAKKANIDKTVVDGIKTVNGKSLIITDPADNNVLITAGITEVTALPTGADIDDSAIYRVTSPYSTALGYEDNNTTGIYISNKDKNSWFHLSDGHDVHVIKSFEVANFSSLNNNAYIKYPCVLGDILVGTFTFNGTTYTNARGTFFQLVEYIGNANQIDESTGLIDPTKMSSFKIEQRIIIYTTGTSSTILEKPVQIMRRWNGSSWSEKQIGGGTDILAGTGLTFAADGKTLNHSNTVTAETSGKGSSTTYISGLKWDAQGHITACTTGTMYPPTSAGTSGQYWKSDGSGQGAWQTPIDSTAAGAISTNATLVTERDVYYGLPYFNNSHSYTSSNNYYAPTTGQTTSYYLQGSGTSGTTNTPAWAAKQTTVNSNDNLITAKAVYNGAVRQDNTAGGTVQVITKVSALPSTTTSTTLYIVV